MKQAEWTSNYSKQFDNFNEDIITGIRKNEKIEKYLDSLFTEVCRFSPENMQYLGYRLDDRSVTFKELNAGQDKKKKKNDGKAINIYGSYARLAVFMFQISVLNQQTKEMDTMYLETNIYIPLYIDNYHFMIRGNKFSAPYQITDSITYTNRTNVVVLKTMIRAIKCTREKKNTPLTDIHGNKFSVQTFNIYMSTKKIPFVAYYFAHFGFAETFRYFYFDIFCKFYDSAPLTEDNERYYFKFGTIFIGVLRERFNTDYLLRQFIATVLEVQKKNLDVDEITSCLRWKAILGANISDNNALQKGEDLLRTFKTSLDHRTIELIKQLIGGGWKENMFSVIRYIFFNFGKLSTKTNSLLNKRIRLSEYLINPVIQTVYRRLYRFLSTSKKNQDLARCADIFKIPPSIITGAVSGKNKNELALDISKFSSACNDNTLLNVALAYTNAGPGSASSKSGSMTSSTQRGIDVSYVGRLDISCSSNSAPGMSGNILQTVKIDPKTLTFK